MESLFLDSVLFITFIIIAEQEFLAFYNYCTRSQQDVLVKDAFKVLQ